jgi:uncharacterized protein
MMKNIFFVLFILNGFMMANAQSSAPKKTILAIQAKVYGDSIVLRWGLSEAAFWLQANERGYYLERLEYTKANSKPLRRMMSALPIKPWTLDLMKQRLQRQDPYSAAAAQILHGKGFTKDLGNDMASFYKLYEEQQSKLLIAMMIADFSPKAANAMGVRWVDKNIDKNAFRYVYRLWINNGLKPNASDLIDTVTVMVNPRTVKEIAAPITSEIEQGDGLLKVKWHKYAPTNRFSGFYVERSKDNKNFERLNKMPYIMSLPDSLSNSNFNANIVEYVDSVKVNYQKFYYRITGIDAFGDISPYSKQMVGFAKDLTPPKVPIKVSKKVENNSRIVISWEMPVPIPPDLKGFMIFRGGYIEGAYQNLTPTPLSPSARSFADQNPIAYKGRYYKIAVIDTAGNIAYAAPIAATIEDKTPPIAPTQLNIKIDTNGIATLQWPQNPEEDIAGYKIYRSYQRDDENYRSITNLAIADTIFTDTLPTNSLTHLAYYKIVAIDWSNNHSEFSAPFVVAIPDKIPPSSPLIKSIVSNTHHLLLNIIPSPSNDVVEYIIYRQEDNNKPQIIKRIQGFKGQPFAIKDSNVVHQKSYQYSIVARDAKGLISKPSYEVPVSFFDVSANQVAAPINVKASYDSIKKGIKVEWLSGALTDKHHFVVYRGLNGQPVSTYKAVSGQSFLLDNSLPQDGTYTYAVRIIVSEKQSVLSQTFSINYQK